MSALHFQTSLTPTFYRFVVLRFLTTIALQIFGISAAWQIFHLTQSPAMLGWFGFVQFVPMLLVTPYAGTIADHMPRRSVALTGLFVCAGGIAALSIYELLNAPDVTAIFMVGIVLGVVRAFAGPALSAMLGELTDVSSRTRAVALLSSTFNIGLVSGPAIGGFLLAAVGETNTHFISSIVLTTSCALLLTIPKSTASLQPMEKGAIAAGLRFVFNKPALLGAFSLDLFAVLLGGAVALLPAVIKNNFHGGPHELGWLRAAPAVGGAAVGLLFTRFPISRHTGKWLLSSVAIFGLATIAFGYSSSLSIAMTMLIIAGAADMVSVFIRQSLVQLETPESMRGRVSAVSLVFISASNELGEFESGLVASLIGVQNAIVWGGIGTVMIALIWAVIFPELRQLDRFHALDETKN